MDSTLSTEPNEKKFLASIEPPYYGTEAAWFTSIGRMSENAGKRHPSDFPPHFSWRPFAGLMLFLATTILASGVLLIVNSTLVYSIYQALLEAYPSQENYAQIWQFLLYLIPVLMLFLEWIVWDRAMDFLFYRKREKWQRERRTNAMKSSS